MQKSNKDISCRIAITYRQIQSKNLERKKVGARGGHKRSSDPLRDEVADGCEPPNTGAGNQTQVLSKSNMLSYH